MLALEFELNESQELNESPSKAFKFNEKPISWLMVLNLWILLFFFFLFLKKCFINDTDITNYILDLFLLLMLNLES